MPGDDVLGRVLAAERAIVVRAVSEVVEIPRGAVVRHPPLAEIWHLNRVHLRAPSPGLDADGLVALAERHLSGMAFHRVTLDDEDAAGAVWTALERRGWRRERSVVMVLTGAGTPDASDPRVSELSESALVPQQTRAFADDAQVTSISSELPARLALAQSALRAGTPWRAFGATPAGEEGPVSSATVYLDDDVAGHRVAFVDQVATLRRFRERGLARAVVSAAVTAAREWGADTIALFADADDWPQVMYAGMGFATIGRQTVVHRDV